MALEMYLKIEGSKQGKFKGESIAGAPPGSTRALQYNYEITSPRDVASGLPTGRRVHKPFVIVKEWDASSPQILQASATNEVLTLVTLDFYRTTATGGQQLYHSVKLSNASISNLKQYVADPVTAAEYDAYDLEEVSFTYQKIEIVDAIGGKSWVDAWDARV